jgi:hypothetical protein
LIAQGFIFAAQGLAAQGLLVTQGFFTAHGFFAAQGFLAAQGFRLLGAHFPAQGLQGLAAIAWPDRAMVNTVAENIAASGR